MALIEIVQGPSKWDLMLAFFDKHPSGMHGIRKVQFTLVTDEVFSLELTSIKRAAYPSPGPWKLGGHAHAPLPKGYKAPEGFHWLELTYDPMRHRGAVELKLVSPCHSAGIDMSLSDGVPIGSCSECHDGVIRMNPRTSAQEWLDGASPWTEDVLRPVATAPKS